MICEGAPPLVRWILVFPDKAELSGWVLGYCKALPGYLDCKIYKLLEKGEL